MSPIQYNPQAINNQAAIRAHFDAAMNAKGGIERGGNVASVAQGVRARIATETRPAFFSRRDLIAGGIFGAVVFASMCAALACHLI